MSRIDRQLADTNERMARIETVLVIRLRALRDMLPQPRAQRFEPGGSGPSIVHCWTHERDVARCLADDLTCTGETIEVHDPTGEAAVAYTRAAGDLHRIRQIVRSHERLSIELETILTRYQPFRIENDRAGIGTCVDCNRYCDGQRDNRLSAYKGTTDMVCISCRSRRDRRAASATCTSVLTRDLVEHRCELTVDHAGRHKGGGFTWLGTSVEAANQANLQVGA